MPTKTLPANPSLEHLKSQAKDLIKSIQAHQPEAAQRIREFHPRFHTSSDPQIEQSVFSLSDAQLTIAREYGFANWTRIRTFIGLQQRAELERPAHERIQNPLFRRAVGLMDSGNDSGLRTHLHLHPELVLERVSLEGGNYFRNPSLIEFCAENPIRHGSLPTNIVDIVKVILDAGAKSDQKSIDETLALVATGRVPRECGVQIPLIALLCQYGADPTRALNAAVGHGEFDAVSELLARGAKRNLSTAAALGDAKGLEQMMTISDSGELHLALAFAAQFGRFECVRLLLKAGEDPNQYNPSGAHSHSTPLHQAAFNGDLDIVRLLVEAGARLDVKDLLWKATPLGWAEYGGQTLVADFLRASAHA